MIRFYFLIEFFLYRYLNCHWIDTVFHRELRGTTGYYGIKNLRILRSLRYIFLYSLNMQYRHYMILNFIATLISPRKIFKSIFSTMRAWFQNFDSKFDFSVECCVIRVLNSFRIFFH